MPYIAEQLTGEAARKHAADTTILGANLPQIAQQIEWLELVCSAFTDPGADWCEYRAYDKDGKLIGQRFTPGY